MTKISQLKSQLKITILGYDVGSVEEATKSIMKQIKQPRKNYLGPIPFPTKRKLLSLITSPHKHKTSQEQFERRTHIRKIWILEPEVEDIAKLNKLILPHTVGIRIKETFSTSLSNHEIT